VSHTPKKPPFNRNDVQILEKDTVWEGFFSLSRYRLRHRKFNGEMSAPMSRERLDKGHGAAAVAFDPIHQKIGLVEQFRVGALESPKGPWCLEVVAGMVEEGETPSDVILRELEEEAGITQATLTRITDYYSTPGGCSEIIHLFCAVCDLSNKEGIYGLATENEDIYFHVRDAQDVFAIMYTSRVNNAATLIALQWLQANHTTLTR